MAWVRFKGSTEYISYDYILFLFHYTQYLEIPHESITQAMNNLFGINVILIPILGAVKLTEEKQNLKIVVGP